MIKKRKTKADMAPGLNKKKNKKGKDNTGKTFFSDKNSTVIMKKAIKKKSASPKEKFSASPSDKPSKKKLSHENHPIMKKQKKKIKAQDQQVFTETEEIHQKFSPKLPQKEKRKKIKRKTDSDDPEVMKKAKKWQKKDTDASQKVSVAKKFKKKKKQQQQQPEFAGSADVADTTAAAGASGSTPGTSAVPARLTVPGGFSWETTSWPQAETRTAGADSSDEEDDAEHQPAARLSRQQLRERAAAEERQLVERERRLMDPSRAPETADDHERLVVAHPDDSSLWIRFMSYFLQATEIEKARGVARRALKTINFREEDEKLNVYVAWLNLESMHGTQETLSNVLHEALQCNDTFKVYTRMAEIHQANNKHDEAELMYSQLVKKLPQRKEAWLRYGVFLMQVERQDAGRALMQRALKCLDRRDHVEVISKFAQLEFRFGEPERGKTMFDHLLATYPKRLDQWNVYVSQLIKTADYDAARLIFQRAATVKLNARRVRSLLKRFLEFEEAHGTAEQQEAVRELARQYVEARSDADAALLDEPAR